MDFTCLVVLLFIILITVILVVLYVVTFLVVNYCVVLPLWNDIEYIYWCTIKSINSNPNQASHPIFPSILNKVGC